MVACRAIARRATADEWGVALSIQDDVIALLRNAIRAHLQLGIKQTFTGFDVEFVLMPRTLENLVFALEHHFRIFPADQGPEST